MIRSAIFVLLAGVALWQTPNIAQTIAWRDACGVGVLFPAGGYYYQIKGACNDR
jgi:hypothetical protein